VATLHPNSEARLSTLATVVYSCALIITVPCAVGPRHRKSGVLAQTLDASLSKLILHVDDIQPCAKLIA